MTRKVCVVTGARAEFGLLRFVMGEINADDKLRLQTIATGMHLSPEFGLTFHEIEQDGFHIDRKVEMLMSSDSDVGISKSVGVGVLGMTDALDALKPDLVLILGDRFEIFAAAIAAMLLQIPIAHIHGGEVTEGAIDDSMRHAITKLASFHFVSTDEYRNRVIQLGEQPHNVFNFGGLGIDCIDRTNLLTKTQLEELLDIQFLDRNLLVTFHPETRNLDQAVNQLDELLKAISELDDTLLIFTCPNADSEGRALIDRLEHYVNTNSNARLFSSLGRQRYYSCLAIVDGVIGNSSSGLLEAPSFKKGTVNIGERQKGRAKAGSIIDCAAEAEGIKAALATLYSENFRESLENTVNPYGLPGASEKIVQQLSKIDLDHASKKIFYDL